MVPGDIPVKEGSARHSKIRQRAHLGGRDAPLQPLHSVHYDHWDTVAVALEQRGVGADVHLIQLQRDLRGEIFQVLARLVTEVTARLGIERHAQHPSWSLSPCSRSAQRSIPVFCRPEPSSGKSNRRPARTQFPGNNASGDIIVEILDTARHAGHATTRQYDAVAPTRPEVETHDHALLAF